MDSRAVARAVFQWDLVVSLWRMADLAEDGGTDHLERALDILRRLDAAGSLYPAQREWIGYFEERLKQNLNLPIMVLKQSDANIETGLQSYEGTRKKSEGGLQQ